MCDPSKHLPNYYKLHNILQRTLFTPNLVIDWIWSKYYTYYIFGNLSCSATFGGDSTFKSYLTPYTLLYFETPAVCQQQVNNFVYVWLLYCQKWRNYILHKYLYTIITSEEVQFLVTRHNTIFEILNVKIGTY